MQVLHVIPPFNTIKTRAFSLIKHKNIFKLLFEVDDKLLSRVINEVEDRKKRCFKKKPFRFSNISVQIEKTILE